MLAATHRFLDIHLSTDRSIIRRQYARNFGRPPDLSHPRSLNEMIQRRKLHDRRPILRMFCDKVAVRDYVAAHVGPEYLVPLLGVFKRPEEIPWDELSAPYVVKASHGCGWNLFVFDSAEADPSKMTRALRDWLKTDFFYNAREWAYKGVPRRIMVERFIGCGRDAPDEFKFLCFDGVPRAAYVMADRFTNPTMTWYSIDWTPLPFASNPGPASPRPAPPALDEMLKVAAKLSQGMDFLRVDLYCVEGRVYCGELTVYPSAGYELFEPPEAGEWLGRFWTLPEHA